MPSSLRALCALATVLVGGLLFAGSASAATCDLNGAADWNVGASWSCGHVPTGADTAVVGAGDTATVAANPLSNPGSLSVAGGQITFSSNAAITAGSMTASGGTLAGSGLLTVSGAFTSSTTTFFVQDSVDLVLNGASSITGGSIGMNGIGGGDPTLTINSSFTIADGVTTPFNHSTGGVFIRVSATGSIIKQGASTATSNSVIENDGTVTAEAGTLLLQGGTLTAKSDGDYLANAGAFIRFEGGNYVIGPNGRLGGAGRIDISALDVNVDAGGTIDTAHLNLTHIGILRINGTTPLALPKVTFTGGGFNPILDTDRPLTVSTLDVAGAGTIAGSASVTVPGTGAFTKTGAGLLTVTHASLGADAADLVLNVDAELEGGGFCIARSDDANPDQPNLHVNQDLLIGSGADAFTFPCGPAAPRVHVNGPSGSLALEGAGTRTSQVGIEVAGGTLTLGSGQTLNAQNGVVQTGGLTEILSGGTLQGIGATVTGGILRGAGQVSGNLTNTSGSVRPGTSPGILTVTGSYTQGSGGTLQAEVDGTTPGTQYDRLAVTGNATLAGTLAIVNGPSFTPATSDTFDVVTAGGTVSGTFSTLTGAAIPAGTYGAQYPAGPPGKATLSLSPAPINGGAPSIPSSAQAGETVTCNPGTWSGSPSFAFQWLRNGAPIAGAGAGAGAYTLTADDAGQSIVCRVTATNGAGSTAASSNTLVPTAAPAPTPAPPTATTATTPSATPKPPARAAAVTVRGEQAFTAGNANDLYLACTTRDLLLIDVLPSGARGVAVTGSADLRLAGRVAEILLDGKVVGRTTIDAAGRFAARVPAPPARSRSRARYEARVTEPGAGVTASQKLKLARRMVATTLTRSGTSLVLRGTVTKPFARRPAVVEIERFLSCRRREKVKVARVVPDRNGRFAVRVPVPAGANAAIYRALTKVAKRRSGPPAERTFTLPRAIDLS